MATKTAGQVLDRVADSTWSRHYSLHSVDFAKELPNLPPAKTPLDSARNGYEYYKHLQAHDGHWPGEYGGPMFLIPGLTIGSYITGIPFTDEERREMIRYLMNHANEDGGWGMYVLYHLPTRLRPQKMVTVTLKGLPLRLEPP
jgi:hypothetical protein